MGSYARKSEADIDISDCGRLPAQKSMMCRNPTEISDYIERQMRESPLLMNKSPVTVHFDSRLRAGDTSKIRKGLRKKGLDEHIQYIP